MSFLLSGSILTFPSIYYPASFLFIPIFCPCVLLLSNLLCWSYEILHFYAIMLVVAHIWYVSRQTDLWLHEARVVGSCWDNMFSYTSVQLKSFWIELSKNSGKNNPIFLNACSAHCAWFITACYSQENIILSCNLSSNCNNLLCLWNNFSTDVTKAEWV